MLAIGAAKIDPSYFLNKSQQWYLQSMLTRIKPSLPYKTSPFCVIIIAQKTRSAWLDTVQQT